MCSPDGHFLTGLERVNTSPVTDSITDLARRFECISPLPPGSVRFQLID